MTFEFKKEADGRLVTHNGEGMPVWCPITSGTATADLAAFDALTGYREEPKQ